MTTFLNDLLITKGECLTVARCLVVVVAAAAVAVFMLVVVAVVVVGVVVAAVPSLLIAGVAATAAASTAAAMACYGRVHVGCCYRVGGSLLGVWPCSCWGEMTGGYSWSLVLDVVDPVIIPLTLTVFR
jgi:hypothetical protein